ncbi:MAG: hypothetical protein HY841_11680 [Bacteroidetes bacterium]|nr:hypothetical protein [Bacteroidota bacterium]
MKKNKKTSLKEVKKFDDNFSKSTTKIFTDEQMNDLEESINKRMEKVEIEAAEKEQNSWTEAGKEIVGF